MLAYLLKQSRAALTLAVIASLLAGACSVLLVVQINAALTAATTAERAALIGPFVAVALGAMLSRMLASILFERLGQKSHAELRRLIAARALEADFRSLEQIGGPRLQSALSEHSANVATFFVSFPHILVNAVVVAGCLLYMALLSWRIFLAAALVIVLGSIGYHLAHLRAIHHLHRAAREQDRLFGHFRALIDGAKELRLHALKRARFHTEVLGRSIENVRRERTFGLSLFAASTSWGNFLIYAFIGLVLFVLVGDTPDRMRVMTGFALVFVYMVAPLEALLMNLPRANLARVSARRIAEIARELAPAEPESTRAPRHFASLELKGVTHRYYHEQSEEMFTLGPFDLSFAPAQLTYLVGGNGSGKTTLAKLLVGLYQPEAGAIWLDGRPQRDTERDDYRQLFSAIFSDFHLFDELLEAASGELDTAGNALLERLQLAHKVSVKQGAFSTRELSQGQRKRLALVVAYLEDRPFVLFDEWAADQDPQFKEVFYRELLPDLKARGKSVLVISHDDRYFHLADRLIRMESGQMSIVEPERRLRPGLAPLS